MSFDDMLNDKLILLKKNGNEIEGIKGLVNKNKIIIYRSDILIETGDLLKRIMTNKGEETYEVIDPCYMEGDGSIESFYNSDVRKLGLPEANQAIQNITTINQYGDNSRVNQDSIDNSVNTINNNNEIMKYITELRNEIQNIVTDLEDKNEYLELVDTVQEQIESGSPKKSVIKSLLKSLPMVASITTIAQFILSMV